MNSKCIIGNINSISDISDKFLDKRIKEDSLPILRNHIKLFYTLPHSGEPMLFNEVAKLWGISKSSLSDIVCKYVSLDIIEKIACPNDKRTVYLKLMPKAYPIIEKLDSYEDNFTNLLLDGFDKEYKSVFKNNIFKALENANKIL